MMPRFLHHFFQALILAQKSNPMIKGCVECNSFLDWKVYNYSLENFGAPLCYDHQNWIRSSKATEHALDLYFALRRRGVPAQLEKFDGHKTIDIAIPECRANVEVDGMQHNYNPRQALSDLKRTYFSFLKGYFTLRVPNSLIKYDLDETADSIVDFLNADNKCNWYRHW